MTLVTLPQTLILVSILVILDPESIFLIVFPISNIPWCMLPLLTFDASVLLSLLLLYNSIWVSNSLFLPWPSRQICELHSFEPYCRSYNFWLDIISYSFHRWVNCGCWVDMFPPSIWLFPNMFPPARLPLVRLYRFKLIKGLYFWLVRRPTVKRIYNLPLTP